MILKDTSRFQEVWYNFVKTGSYCNYTKDSYAYKEFWLREDDRCRNGLKLNDLYIPGAYYFYLNYYPILAKDEKTGRKSRICPRFTDVDLEYFSIIERARKEQKGVILAKPRRTGFSFKNSCLVTHEYNFYKEAKCVIGAYLSDLSTNTMSMCIDGLNWLDKHTEWKKQRNPDTRTFVKARYKETVDGIDIWKGYNSQIEVVTFKDNPFASIGKTTNLFIFEEGGKFPNLIESYNISEPCWRDGEDMIGIPIIYGTGGDMEGGTVEFAEMFYNPEKFNLLAFDNIWDDDKSGSKCGWFIPANRMRFGKFEYEGKTVDLVDSDGNSNVEAATASIMKLRELKSKSGVDKDYRDTITQFPLKPAEAFLRSGYNKFPVAELQQVLGKIESTKSYEYDEKYVELFFNEKAPRGVDYNILHNAKPLVDYPVKEVQREGCIVVYEFPIELPDGTTPPELYMIAHDPTKNDDEGNSLAGIQVYKTHRYFNLYGHDEVVAEFYGRRGKDDINEILEKLAMWYGLSNKMLFFENAVGNTKEYFERKKKLYYLCTQPQTIFNKKAAFTSTGNIIYGYPMSNQYIKAEAEDYLKEWLLEDRNKEGNLKNLHLLKSRMLLKQLIAYNRDGNFDAVMTAVGWASGRRERFNIYEKEKERENKTNKLDFLINNKKVFNNGSKSIRVRS